MAEILTKENLAKRRFENGAAENVVLYDVKKVDDALLQTPLTPKRLPVVENSLRARFGKGDGTGVVTMKSAVYKNSEGERALLADVNEIVSRAREAFKSKAEFRDVLKNSGAPSQYPSDLLDLVYAFQLDLTRRIMQEADYTDYVTNVITNAGFTKSINLMELQRYTGVFKKNGLNGEAVPMIQQKTGAKDAVTLQGYALGWAHTLEDLLFNTLFSMDKVNDAFIRAFVGLRNDLCIGLFIHKRDGTTARTYHAAQHVDADTEGQTYDERLYNTMNAAIESLKSLHDFQSKKEIDVPRIAVLVGSNVAARAINRVVNGQLNNSKGTTANREALEIDDIIRYVGDTFDWNDERIEYEGVPSGKAYMFVPGSSGAPWWTLVKAGLTQQNSSGDALTLSQEHIARWFAQTQYEDEFFGSSSENTTITNNDTDLKYGYVVEISLPEAET